MKVQGLRMPVSVASRKGVSALAAASVERPVILTSLGRPVAVVRSAERVDDDLRPLREGARVIVEAYADKARGRTSGRTVSELCARLDLDENDVRSRARELSEHG